MGKGLELAELSVQSPSVLSESRHTIQLCVGFHVLFCACFLLSDPASAQDGALLNADYVSLKHEKE